MARVNVPASGPNPAGWFDLKDPSVLTPDHQDEYFDLGDRLREEKRAKRAAEQFAANPAVQPDPDGPVRLSRTELFPIYSLVLSWVHEGNSFGAEMPLTREGRNALGLAAWNAVKEALDPCFDVLNGNGPKETPPPDGTTSGTSATT